MLIVFSLFFIKKSANSRLSYLSFCEFTIQCLHTSASHLNDRDQRLPADRPYTNGYFLDLVSQVRRYAAMIRAERERVPATRGGNPEEKSNLYVLPFHPKYAVVLTRHRVHQAHLEHGISKDGKPLELVVMQDGKPISMLTGKPYEVDSSISSSSIKRTINLDDAVDEGVQRSMARRKKNAPPMDINQKCSHCDKVFKRPCDLT
jgi:hypothetical protein